MVRLGNRDTKEKQRIEIIDKNGHIVEEILLPKSRHLVVLMVSRFLGVMF